MRRNTHYAVAAAGGTVQEQDALTAPSLSVTSNVTADGLVRRLVRPAWVPAGLTIDTDQGSWFLIIATSNAAWTVLAPTGGLVVEGAEILITMRNASGGALGAQTWNAAFKRITALNPANNAQATVRFGYDGTNWIELQTGAITVPV